MTDEHDDERPDPTDTRVRPKRRRLWLWLWVPGGVLVLILVAALVGWVIVGSKGKARWKTLEARQADLRSRVVLTSSERAPLEGVGIPGNAWEHYRDAAAAFEALPKKDQEALIMGADAKTTPEKDARAFGILEAHPEILAAVREAAKCDFFDANLGWEQGLEMRLDWLAQHRRTSRILAVEARRRRGLRDLDGALDCVALCMQLGADTGRSGMVINWVVGIAIRGIGMAQVAQIATDPDLKPEQAERLEKLMTKLEAELVPLHKAMEADQLAFGYSILSAGTSTRSNPDEPNSEFDRILRDPSKTWRHGFSRRIALAHVADMLEKQTRCVEASEQLAWPEAMKQYDAFANSTEDDPLVEGFTSAPFACDNSGRSGLARIRLIRALCHERRTGAPANPLPADPHTLAPLHRRVDADRVVYWAEWSDGNNEGKGKFEENPDKGGDIVLEWVK